MTGKEISDAISNLRNALGTTGTNEWIITTNRDEVATWKVKIDSLFEAGVILGYIFNTPINYIIDLLRTQYTEGEVNYLVYQYFENRK